MSRAVLRVLPLFLITFAALTPARAADCAWRVFGVLAVQDDRTAAPAVKRPLAGVTVQVAATLYGWGGYTTWNTVETDASGRFEVSASKSCSARRFRVWAKLDNADLAVRNPAGDEWMLLRDDGATTLSAWRASLALGAWTFDRAATGALGDGLAVDRAISWSMATKLMDHLESVDPWLGFGRKVHVKYPAGWPTRVAWAAVDTVYIPAGGWNVTTLMHELTHLWNYDHNSGVTNWLSAVLWDFNTHGAQEEPAIAFHEGFAEFGADLFLNELYPERFGNYDGWSFRAWDSLAAIERNDYAVRDVLQTVEGRFMPRFDMLKCFRANAALGYPRDLDLGGTEHGLVDYLQRCSDLMASFTDDELATLYEILVP